MTGSTAGYCAGYRMPGYANPVPGRGYGMGWGRGRAWGGWGRGRDWHWYRFPVRARFGHAQAWGAPWAGAFEPGVAPPGPSPQEEVEFLRAQADWLQEELAVISSRLEELGQDE